MNGRAQQLYWRDGNDLNESLSHLQYTLVVIIIIVVTENHHYVNKINRTMTKNDKRGKSMMVVGGWGTHRVFSNSVELVTYYKTKYRHATTWPSECTNKVFIESRTPSVTHIPAGVSQPVNPRHCTSLWYALLTSPIAASPWVRRPTRVILIRVSFLACFY